MTLRRSRLGSPAPVGAALSRPLARSALGSLSEGAAEQSEAKGVYFVEWYEPKSFEFLASPEGKLAWQIIGTSEPIIYHD